MDSIHEQFSHIYDQNIEKIYRFVYLKVNSQEIAEDIVSKVFMKGWEAYQRDSAAIKNPSAFLYQIARNAVIDFYRQKGRSKVVSEIQEIKRSHCIQNAYLLIEQFKYFYYAP